jgi:hypothetical protein
MQFGGLKAINQVDIRIKRGTIHGLIGPNGSVKSTDERADGIYQPTWRAYFAPPWSAAPRLILRCPALPAPSGCAAVR